MSTEPSRQQPSQGLLPGKATIRPSDEKQVSTQHPPPLAGVFEIALDGETGDAATEPKFCSGTKAEISICRAAH
jgi:hypothetical protein